MMDMKMGVAAQVKNERICRCILPVSKVVLITGRRKRCGRSRTSREYHAEAERVCKRIGRKVSCLSANVHHGNEEKREFSTDHGITVGTILGTHRQQTYTNNNSIYNPSNSIRKYRVVGKLGSGSSSDVYSVQMIRDDDNIMASKGDFQRADPHDKLLVAKVVTYNSIANEKRYGWSSIDVLKREYSILSSLKNAQGMVPCPLEFFEEHHQSGSGDRKDRNKLWIMVFPSTGAKQYSLQDHIKVMKTRFTENEVENIIVKLLEILVFLEKQRPPVVHRDIKPANITLDENGNVQLIDFGGAQDVVTNLGSFTDTIYQDENLYSDARLVSGSKNNILGSFGYISPEQLQGISNAKSDQYSVAMCILFIMSGRNPTDFPSERLKVDSNCVCI